MIRMTIAAALLSSALSASAAGFLQGAGAGMIEAQRYEDERREQEYKERIRKFELQRQQLELERARNAEQNRAAEAEGLRREIRELEQRRAALADQEAKEQQAREAAEQAAQAEWRDQVAAFMSAHPEYAKDTVKYGALDAVVKDLANRPEYREKSGRWFLETAHTVVEARFAPATAPKPPARKKSTTM